MVLPKEGAKLTKKELAQLRGLKREIQLLQEQRIKIQRRLQELEALRCAKASGGILPYQRRQAGEEVLLFSGDTSYLQHMASSIAERQRRYVAEYETVMAFIASIPDSMTRQIFELRFVSAHTWPQVAAKTGGTEDSVRKTVERYLEKSKKLSDTSACGILQ